MRRRTSSARTLCYTHTHTHTEKHTHVYKYIYAQSMWKKMKNNAGLRALSSATRNENEAKVEG